MTALALLASLFVMFAASGAAPRPVAFTVRTMGTYGRVSIVTADSAAAAPAAAAALADFARVDSLMSNWTATSELARLNREAGSREVTVHPELAAVLARALEVGRESRGAFDVTVEPLVRLWGFLGGPRRVPSDSALAATLPRVGLDHLRFDPARRVLRYDRPDVRVDLGGIAKGHAVDAAAGTLREHGVTAALVDVSGNMAAIGAPPGAAAWRIGIRDPRDRVPFFARLTLRDEGISTSGQYQQFLAADGRRYGHILDPRTGRPVEGAISVTVVSASALTCDAWDTPLFVMGPAEARRVAKARADIALVLVTPGDGARDTVWIESDLAGRFHLEAAAESLFVARTF